MMSSLSLLSKLWLREPDEELLTAARRLPAFAGIAGDCSELATAYNELFLLNVYPYGSVYTDSSGELNGPSACQVARRFEDAGYCPTEISQVGSPDHAGLCLGYLAHCEATGREDPFFLQELALWLPVCALAVEKEASTHPFYRRLARRTTQMVLAGLPDSALPAPRACLEGLDPEEGEVSLSDIVRFLLSPARCGFFLSRSRLGRLGRVLGLFLPFAGRFDLASTLFSAAGESDLAPKLFDSLLEELSCWESEYRQLAQEHQQWLSFESLWIARLEFARRRLKEMRAALDRIKREEQNGAPAALTRYDP